MISECYGNFEKVQPNINEAVSCSRVSTLRATAVDPQEEMTFESDCSALHQVNFEE